VPTHITGDLALVDYADPQRAAWERDIAQTAHSPDPGAWALVRPLPGVGNVLALVRRYEIEAMARFPRVQAFVSDSRLVQSARESHGQRHGTSGQQIENAHLTWAFSEAAGLLLKNHEPAPRCLGRPVRPAA
jgi:transposase